MDIQIPLAYSPDWPLGHLVLFDLPETQGMKGFLIQTLKGPRAWVNKCRHWPVPLDLDDGEVYHPPSHKIICKSHGARYNPESGICEIGPCEGERLHILPYKIVDQEIIITWDGQLTQLGRDD